MAELLIDDVPVLQGRVTIPRRGAWHADLVLDGDAVPDSPVFVQAADGTTVLVGAVRRGAVRSGRVEVRVIGGAGGLAKLLEPKFYRSPSVRLVLEDLARESGETLSASITQDLLGTVLPAWTRRGGLASHCFAGLARALGLVFRVLLDGTVWMGRETWTAAPAFAYDLMGDHAAQRSAVIATETLEADLVPGCTFLGRRVGLVQHDVAPDRMRTTLLFERDDADAEGSQGLEDAAAGPLEAFVRSVTQRTAFHTQYAGRVVSQDGQGRVDVVPDRADLPGLTAVRILGFVPGAVVRVAEGTRVLVGFVDGDPQAPGASLWEGGTAEATEATDVVLPASGTIKLGAGATRGAARMDDTVGAGTLVLAASAGVAAGAPSATRRQDRSGRLASGAATGTGLGAPGTPRSVRGTSGRRVATAATPPSTINSASTPRHPHAAFMLAMVAGPAPRRNHPLG